MFKGHLKNIFKLIIILFVLLGAIEIACHHAHALGDTSHHEETCELCAVYESLSKGITHTPAIPIALCICIAISVVVAFQSQQRNSFDLSLLHPGLDPPSFT